MTKYDPLTDWLREFTADRTTLSFAQIEKILGSALPSSSQDYQAHWRSNGPGRPGGAIAAAGWGVEHVDQRGRSITLVRRGHPAAAIAPSASAASAATVVVPSPGAGDVPADWFWEGHVQDVMVAYLRSDGWKITSQSDTANRARGDDIAAVRDGHQLVVEVKGYPSKAYRDPRRANEVKRTNPTLQAKHWFADALLKTVRLRGSRPEVAVAMAFPEAPRYRSLVAETRGTLERLGIGVYFVHPNADVEVVSVPR